MAKYCNIYDKVVIYADCMECENKSECKAECMRKGMEIIKKKEGNKIIIKERLVTK